MRLDLKLRTLTLFLRPLGASFLESVLLRSRDTTPPNKRRVLSLVLSKNLDLMS